ncbi:CMP-sialic acid transporter 4-like [Benincasa hispida]|uniref:CMP-sialic acid transporter 4-like n=1 Tax=Benincasa hispida TaxID=102211 RepID=UPI001901FEF1|nr:CMP-sialic acid transporter 4-like [Benincasa hispida]
MDRLSSYFDVDVTKRRMKKYVLRQFQNTFKEYRAELYKQYCRFEDPKEKDGNGDGSGVSVAVADDIESLCGGKAISGASNVAKLGANSFDRSKWQQKSIVTLALTVLTSSQAILIVWSKRAGKYEYSVTTANFMVETLKCVLSLAALSQIWESEGVTEDNKLSTTYDEVIVYSIPAALYLVKNLLQYYIFAYVDAPGYQILKNFNIISTGILYRIILKKKLSEIQLAAFILLCAGCTTAQLNSNSDHVLQTPFQGCLMAIVSSKSVMLYEGVCCVGRVMLKVLIILMVVDSCIDHGRHLILDNYGQNVGEKSKLTLKMVFYFGRKLTLKVAGIEMLVMYNVC